MSDEATESERYGGIYNSGVIGSVGGDIVGGNKIIAGNPALDAALAPVQTAIASSPPDVRKNAEDKLNELKQEAAKENPSDGILAGIVKGIADLVPSAVSAVVSAFGTPILGAVAGPVTKLVLDSFRGK